jgi:lipid-A-disaccharide synthase-like uncharacterized protein
MDSSIQKPTHFYFYEIFGFVFLFFSILGVCLVYFLRTMVVPLCAFNEIELFIKIKQAKDKMKNKKEKRKEEEKKKEDTNELAGGIYFTPLVL